MKIIMKIILAIALSLITSQLYAKSYIYKIERVIDGDTIEIDTSKDGSLLKELGLSVRVYGIDTPEKGSRAKCKKENDLGQQATEFTKNLIGNKEVLLDIKKWDKFGGRILATVQVDGLNIADELIKRNLAVPYFGEKKEKDWCK